MEYRKFRLGIFEITTFFQEDIFPNLTKAMFLKGITFFQDRIHTFWPHVDHMFCQGLLDDQNAAFLSEVYISRPSFIYSF